MSEYPNSGAMFKNDKGDNPKRPDMTGSCEVDGVDYWISCWSKEAKSGKKFLSLSFKPKEEGDSKKPATPDTKPKAQDDDDLPF